MLYILRVVEHENSRYAGEGTLLKCLDPYYTEHHPQIVMSCFYYLLPNFEDGYYSFFR